MRKYFYYKILRGEIVWKIVVNGKAVLKHNLKRTGLQIRTGMNKQRTTVTRIPVG